MKEIPEELVEDVGEGVVIGAGRGGVERPWLGRFESGQARGLGAAGRSGANRRRARGAERRAPAPSSSVSCPATPSCTPVSARGSCVEVEGEGEDARATICFPDHGEKRFLLALSPLERPAPGCWRALPTGR